MDEVQERIKDITYSSRTRMNTDAFVEKYRLRRALRKLAPHVPRDVLEQVCAENGPVGRPAPPLLEGAYSGPTATLLEGAEGRVSLVHIINRANRHDIQSKDYDFWRVSVQDRWRDGMADARLAMQATAWRSLTESDTGLAVYDYLRPHETAV